MHNDKEYKKIELVWIDSKGGGDWEFFEDLVSKAAIVKTIGYLISEDEESITIAHSIAKNQCCGRITIPKVCIRSEERKEVMPSDTNR